VLDDLNQSVQDLVQRSNPKFATRLKAINTGYANYVRVRRAASSAGAVDGVFTPAQLSAGVRGSDTSVGKGAYARGDALMQDLSDAGKSVLPSKIPDSGTPERLLWALGSLGAGFHFNPAIPAAQLGAASLYTRPGTAIVRHALTSRPVWAPAARNAIERYSAPFGFAPVFPLANAVAQGGG
jgi:hypothetical protein